MNANNFIRRTVNYSIELTGIGLLAQGICKENVEYSAYGASLYILGKVFGKYLDNKELKGLERLIKKSE